VIDIIQKPRQGLIEQKEEFTFELTNNKLTEP